jgi:hypothetical protein
MIEDQVGKISFHWQDSFQNTFVPIVISAASPQLPERLFGGQPERSFGQITEAGLGSNRYLELTASDRSLSSTSPSARSIEVSVVSIHPLPVS